jgi:hypothetical protein
MAVSRSVSWAGVRDVEVKSDWKRLGFWEVRSWETPQYPIQNMPTTVDNLNALCKVLVPHFAFR